MQTRLRHALFDLSLRRKFYNIRPYSGGKCVEFPDELPYNKKWQILKNHEGVADVKDLTLLTWLTQLGLTVALPLVGFILLAVWLRGQCGWGEWVLWVGIGLGLISAIDGLRQSLKILSRLTGGKTDNPPPVSFQEHD